MMKTVIGVFQDRSDVERAIDKFKSEGFQPKDFSIVMKDKQEAQDIGSDTGANVAGGAVSGAASGAVLGALAGLIAGIAIPGAGAFLIGGPIAAALGLTGAAATTVSGAATGAVVGGIAGALMGMGLSREDAEYYEGRVNEGAILLAVPTRENQQELVMTIFDDSNASDVKTISHEETAPQRTQQHNNHDDHRQYAHAHMGAKGGKVGQSDNKKGKGWHGESKEHAVAAKGKKTTKRGKTK
jgi:uncharacterized membrane protein